MQVQDYFVIHLGHGRREITEAVTKQLETLDYAQPFQQGFGGSFELATKISKHTPGDLNKMFLYNLWIYSCRNST